MNKFTPPLLIIIIIACVGISGYLILSPKSQSNNQSQTVSGLAPMVDGKQVIAMTVKAASYNPDYFKVKVGVPVTWEITSSGEPSCDSGAIISDLLPSGSVYLNPNKGQITVTEFTPQKIGIYNFTCPMGMVRGTIEVIN